MGGLFKPSGSSTTQKTSVTPYNDDTYNYLSSGFNTINNNVGQPGTGYSGNTATGWTSGQQSALDNAKGYLDSNSLTAKVANGEYLDVAKNPAYQQAIKDLQSQFGSNVDSLNTKFSPWVSSSMRNNAAGDLAKSFNEGLASAWSNQYNTEMNRALGAQQTMSGYNKDVSNLEAIKQNTQQAALDADYNEWVRQQNQGNTNTTNFLSLASLLQSPTTTTNSSTKQKSTFLGK